MPGSYMLKLNCQNMHVNKLTASVSKPNELFMCLDLVFLNKENTSREDMC